MTLEILQPAVILHELDDDESQALLRDALTSNRSVEFQNTASSPTVAAGRIRDAANRMVVIDCDCPLQSSPDAPGFITLEMDGEPYAVRIDHNESEFDSKTHRFTMPWPVRIARMERRQSRRRTFRRQRSVALCMADGTRIQAAMLNLSVDGLACRVDAETADAMASTQRLTTIVESDQDGGLEISATVASITPLSSKGAFAIGLEFNYDVNLRSQLEALLDCQE